MATNWAVKAACKLLLNRILRKFIMGDLNLESVEVNMGRRTASLQLNHVTLDTGYINNNSLHSSALLLKTTSIGSLSVALPWSSNSTEKFKISLENVEIVMALRDTDFTISKHFDSENTAKMFSTGFIQQLVQKLGRLLEKFVLGVQVSIKNVVVRLELGNNVLLQLRVEELNYEANFFTDESSALKEGANIGILTSDMGIKGGRMDVCEGSLLHPKRVVPVLEGYDKQGFITSAKFRIPWRCGSLEIPQVDVEVVVDHLQFMLDLFTIQPLIDTWQSFKERRGSKSFAKAEDDNVDMFSSCLDTLEEDDSFDDGDLPEEMADLFIIFDWIKDPEVEASVCQEEYSVKSTLEETIYPPKIDQVELSLNGSVGCVSLLLLFEDDDINEGRKQNGMELSISELKYFVHKTTGYTRFKVAFTSLHLLELLSSHKLAENNAQCIEALQADMSQALPKFPISVTSDSLEEAEKERASDVKIKILSCENTCEHQFCFSCEVKDEVSLGTNFELQIPPFVIWCDFYAANKLWKLSKNIKYPMNREQNLSATKQGSLHGTIYVPWGRMILCFADDFERGSQFSLKQEFVCLDVSLPPIPVNECQEGRSNTKDEQSIEKVCGSVNFKIGETDLYLVTSVDSERSSFKVRKIFSLVGEDKNCLPVISLKWKAAANSTSDTAWYDAKAHWGMIKGETLTDMCETEAGSVRRRRDYEVSNSETLAEIVRSSSTFVYLSIARAEIDLNGNEHLWLLNHLSERCEYIFKEDSATSLQKENKVANKTQFAVLCECKDVSISITLEEPQEVKGAIERELRGGWNSFELNVTNLEILNVGNCSNVEGSKHFSLKHDEGDLYGTLRRKDKPWLTHRLHLLSCKKDALGRGDGRGTNVLASPHAGTCISIFDRAQTWESIKMFSFNGITLIAPGARIDWIEGIVLFFTQETRNDTDVAIEQTQNHGMYSNALLIEVHDIALSYEPFPLKKTSSGLVSSIISVTELSILNEAIPNKGCNEFSIVARDLGFLIADKQRSGTIGYDALSLSSGGFVKIGGQNLMKMIVKTASEEHGWEVLCKRSDLEFDTCYDSIAALGHLVKQLQLLFEPDSEQLQAFCESLEPNDGATCNGVGLLDHIVEDFYSESRFREKYLKRGDIGKKERPSGRIQVEGLNVTWRLNGGSDWPGLGSDKKLLRGHKQAISIEVNDANFQCDIFPEGRFKVKLCITVKDAFVFDKSNNAPWKTMVLPYHSHKKHPRDCSLDALRLDVEITKPETVTSNEEHRVIVQLHPIQVHLSQSQLEFLLHFFSNMSPSSEMVLNDDDDIHQGDGNQVLLPFFRKFEIRPSMISVNYVPSHLNLELIVEGEYEELLKMVPLQDIQVKLKGVTTHGVYGLGPLIETVMEEWVKDIRENQVYRLAKGLAPVRSVCSVGGALKKLVIVPSKRYKEDGRLLAGIKKGVGEFVRTLAVEVVECGVQILGGVHGIISHTENALEAVASPSSCVERSNTKAKRPCQNTKQGVKEAFGSMKKGIGKAARSVIVNPMASYSRGKGARESAIKAIQNSPAAAIAPVSAAAQALHKALVGVRSTLDPHHKQTSLHKHQGPCQH